VQVPAIVIDYLFSNIGSAHVSDAMLGGKMHLQLLCRAYEQRSIRGV